MRKYLNIKEDQWIIWPKWVVSMYLIVETIKNIFGQHIDIHTYAYFMGILTVAYLYDLQKKYSTKHPHITNSLISIATILVTISSCITLVFTISNLFIMAQIIIAGMLTISLILYLIPSN